MLGVNKVIILGHVGREPETKQAGSQNVSNFTIATTERWTKDGKKQEKTEWHNVVAWGKLADIVAQYVKKGNAVYIEGKLQTRSWDDKDGNKKYKTEIVASNVQLLGGKGDKNAGDQAPQQHATPDDELPF